MRPGFAYNVWHKAKSTAAVAFLAARGEKQNGPLFTVLVRIVSMQRTSNLRRSSREGERRDLNETRRRDL